MVRISKLTDYAVVIMAHIAGVSMISPSTLLQAKEIAKDTHLALPTVSKLLKALTKHQFLHSSRGTHGGYQLAIAPEKVSIVDLIQALEGPFAITECNLGHKHCSSEMKCAIRKPWLHINQMITHSLEQIKLSNIIELNNPVANSDEDSEIDFKTEKVDKVFHIKIDRPSKYSSAKYTSTQSMNPIKTTPKKTRNGSDSIVQGEKP